MLEKEYNINVLQKYFIIFHRGAVTKLETFHHG
jgi:hypothetical protein